MDRKIEKKKFLIPTKYWPWAVGGTVLLGLLAGLIFLMGQTPLGLIPLGFCNVTLLVIPVAVGTIYMGWKNGLILGATFAATSTPASQRFTENAAASAM